MPTSSTTARQLSLPLRGAGTASRRLYTLPKSEVTRSAVLGSARKILRASNGAPAYISAARVMSMTGLGERQVRKYLGPCVRYMEETGEILLETKPGQGYLARTPEWQAETDAHGDAFEPARFRRSPWLNRAQRIKMEHGDRMAKVRRNPHGNPCTFPHTHIGRSKPIKKQRRRAPAMVILAGKIISRKPLPESRRFQIDPGQWQAMVAEALTAEHCQFEVARWVGKAGQALDAAISDRLSQRPEAYLWGIWRGFMKAAKPKGRASINADRRMFWTAERAKSETFMEENPQYADPDLLPYIDRKLASCGAAS